MMVEADSTVRNAIEYVKNQQQSVLHSLEAVSPEIISINPAFQWAQNLDNVYISIKLATRYDSPGCIDIIEKNIEI